MKPFILIILTFLSSIILKAESLSLISYLELVKKQNLDLKIEQSSVASSKSKAVGFSIPPPSFSLMQFKESDGGTNHGYEVMQTLPFPSKLIYDRAARKAEYLGKETLQKSIYQQTLSQAKLLFYSVWEYHQRESFLEQKRTLLQEHIKISRSAARSDSFAAIHVLKAETDSDLLENEIEATKQILIERQSALSSFINADLSENLVLNEPAISPMPQAIEIEKSHLYHSRLINLERLQELESLAKSAWLPDFTFRYKEMGVSNSSNKSNEIAIGITLPFLFFWEPYAGAQQATLQKKVAEFELAKDKKNLASENIILFKRAQSLRRQLDNLYSKLIPRAEKRMKLVKNLAPRDLETLQDHRETMEALPELKLKALELRMDYEKSIASLEKFSTNYESQNE